MTTVVLKGKLSAHPIYAALENSYSYSEGILKYHLSLQKNNMVKNLLRGPSVSSDKQ